jgi:hypothetical protein
MIILHTSRSKILFYYSLPSENDFFSIFRGFMTSQLSKHFEINAVIYSFCVHVTLALALDQRWMIVFYSI